jgi:hypothetical protein
VLVPEVLEAAKRVAQVHLLECDPEVIQRLFQAVHGLQMNMRGDFGGGAPFRHAGAVRGGIKDDGGGLAAQGANGGGDLRHRVLDALNRRGMLRAPRRAVHIEHTGGCDGRITAVPLPAGRDQRERE